MTPRGDSELALRLLKDSFFLGTGINISMMFCLETFIVETTDLPGYYKNEVVARFQALLGSGEVVDRIAESVSDYYTQTFGDNPLKLDNILSLLDGPLSIEVSFYLTLLDPDFRQSVRRKCIELADRYKGALTLEQAVSVIGIIFDTCDETLFADKRFALWLSPEKRKEMEEDFAVYMSRYRDSSLEEIENRKVRFNVGMDSAPRPSMPVGAEEGLFTDWRSFVRFSYLSSRFSVFPELNALHATPVTTQESLFIPRPVEITRFSDKRKFSYYDGIRYFRDKLARPQPKLLNLHGERGSGLSSFARMLTVTLASAFSRGTSKLIPIYVDLRGRTSTDMQDLAGMIDKDVLRNVDELTLTWSTEHVILLLDNFDRVRFDDAQQRERFASSLFDLAQVLRFGAVVLVTDTPVKPKKIGLDAEGITLADFTDANIRDWLRNWPSAVNKLPVTRDDLSREISDFLSLPLSLWMVLGNALDDLRDASDLTLCSLLEFVFEGLLESCEKVISAAERRSVEIESLDSLFDEIAWFSYSYGKSLEGPELLGLMKQEGLTLQPVVFSRIAQLRFLDVRGSKPGDISVSFPSSSIRDYLVARRFIASLKSRQIVSVLGRPIKESVFSLVTELLKRTAVDGDSGLNELKQMRETCWQWFSYSAVAIVPQKKLREDLIFSEFDLFPEFRLLSILTMLELTRLIGDDVSISRGDPRSFSLLLKLLQCSSHPDRVDFRKHMGGANLKGVQFEDIDLSGADFSNSRLDSAKFARCNLDSAVLMGAALSGGSFDSCRMRGMVAKGADLTGCTVRYCDMSEAVLREAQVEASSFVNVSFKGSDLSGVRMSKSSVVSSSLVSANMTGGKFAHSNFQSVDFVQTKVTGAEFANCVFGFCLFDESELLIADFRGSQLSRVLLLNCIGDGLSAAKCEFTSFTCANCSFREADLSGAKMVEANLRKCILADSLLSSADLSDAFVRDCDLSRATLTMALLQRANLSGTVGLDTVKTAEGADLSGVTGLDLKIRAHLRKSGARDEGPAGFRYA